MIQRASTHAVLTALVAACSGAIAPQRTTTPEPCFYDCKPTPPSEPCIYDCRSAATSRTAPATGRLGLVGEKVQLLREAAEQLEKAAVALAGGHNWLAEQLFSSAELLAPDALASLSPLFREGAPPRVTAPVVKVDPNAKPQPIAVGSTETEDETETTPAPKPDVERDEPRVEIERPKQAPSVPRARIELGSLSGTILVDGQRSTGHFGLVTLEPVSGTWKPRTPKQHVIEQRGREFRPHVIAISVGSTVTFPNFDPFFHNVFSTSLAAAFDLGIYRPGEARAYKFARQGIVRLGCNLHANMSAYIAVVSAPSYVVTDANGTFEFKRVAPGRYTLRAWSERSMTPTMQTVSIQIGKNEAILNVIGNAPTGPQPDKFGGQRAPDSAMR